MMKLHAHLLSKLKQLLLLFFVSLFFIACSPTKNIITTTTLHDTVFTKELNPLTDSIFNNAHVGLCVYEPASDSYWYQYQGNKFFMPSSNVKIATCYAAMKYLGDSITGIRYSEDSSTVYIQGSGDPTFLHENFTTQKVFNWLKTKSSKRIILTEPNFKALPYGKGWSWDDYEEAYMQERSALPIHNNLVKFYYQNGYKTYPPLLHENITAGFEASNGDTKFSVRKRLGTNDFTIIPGKKDTVNIPFSSTPYKNFTADLLGSVLGKKIETGIAIISKKIFSQPTDSILKTMMYNSDNFFAEQALLMLSNEILGMMSDEKMIDSLLKSDFAHLPQKPRWVDGSGLSRYNLFSPEDFVSILNKMKKEFSWTRIKGIFPSGDQGTLKGLLKNEQGKIFAKSGSMSNNYSLSGFATTHSGKEIIFSIIINNHQTTSKLIKEALEKFLTSMIIER